MQSVKFTIAAIDQDNIGATRYHDYILSKTSGKPYIYKDKTRNPALTETQV